jgi:hypothetical protein
VGVPYEFPPGTDGSVQGVAIIELGVGFRPSDLAHYFQGLGLATAPTVTAVAVAGGANTPGGDADAEVLLDIEVIGALAPAAALSVYFAPNTDQGFYEAISQAAHDAQRRNTVMSISWGGPEDSWSSSHAVSARGRRGARVRHGRLRRQRLERRGEATRPRYFPPRVPRHWPAVVRSSSARRRSQARSCGTT